MRRGGAGEPREVVAAFQERNDPSAGVPVGDAADEAREIGEILVVQKKLPQRVAQSRIEPCGNQDKLGPEFFRGGQELFLECCEDSGAAGPGGKRAVDRRAETGAGACLIGAPRAGIPRRLVRAEKEHRAIGVKDILRPVAVVHVPIDDQCPREAVPALRVPRGEGDVVNHAESHPEIDRCVMPRRANDTERICRVPADDGVHRRHRAPRGSHCRCPRVLADHCVASAELDFS